MTTAADRDMLPGTALLPGSVVIARIRRLLYVALAAGVLYSMFVSASKSGCPGGITDTGAFIDANGQPTDIAPVCVNMTLRPSPLVLIAIAAIVLWAIDRVLRRADTEASAVRILDRAALAIMIAAAVSVVIAQVWFALTPLYGLDGAGTYLWPFPFGSVDLQTSPMSAP